MKSSKRQHPTSKKAPSTKFQGAVLEQGLEFEVWNFSGAWSLEFGA
jgi:hypothetical protein